MNTTEKLLLEAVLLVCGDDEKRIPEGVSGALKGFKGDAYKAQRAHYWAILPGKAQRKIRAAREKAERNHPVNA